MTPIPPFRRYSANSAEQYPRNGNAEGDLFRHSAIPYMRRRNRTHVCVGEMDVVTTLYSAGIGARP